MASKQIRRLGQAPEEGIKAPVSVATTVNIDLQGLQVISGRQLVDGDRVLVKDQDDATENGIYRASIGEWCRATDWNRSDDVINGQLVVDANTRNIYQTAIAENFEINVNDVTFLPYDQIATAIIEPAIELQSGQRDVTFTVVDAYAAFYITGLNTDVGRLINVYDYTITGAKSIRLTNSQPEGSLIYGVQADLADQASGSVTAFNGRTGNVTPTANDYTALQVSYDKADSTLSAQNVKAAIDELDVKVTRDNANNQTGTSYTLLLSDVGKTVWMNNASANTLSIPLDSTINFPTNTVILIMMEGVGVTSVTAVAGVTLNGIDGGSGDLEQYKGVTLVKRASNTWIATPLEVA